MVLFLLFSLPALYGMVALLPWDPWKRPPMLVLVSSFFKGVLLFFPGYLVILILRAIIGFSYSGAWLFISLFLRDQFLPLFAALTGFYLFRKMLAVPTSEEGAFLVVFAYLAGFLSLINVTDALRLWGAWDSSTLFLLPAARISQALIVAMLARRYYPWEGREAVVFGGIAAVLAGALTLSGYLMLLNRPGWAIVLAIAPVLGSVIGFSLRFPRAVRG